MNKANQPLESFYTLYKLSLQFDNRSPNTIETNTKRLRQFATWLERTAGRPIILADYTVENLHAYVAYLRTKRRWDDNQHVPTDEKPLSPFTIQDQLRTLKAFSSCLYAEGHTHENTFQRVPMPRRPNCWSSLSPRTRSRSCSAA